MSWREYYEKMVMEPRPALLRAIEYFSKHPPRVKIAYDLGCGNGRDSLPLLKEGWTVFAVDSEPVAEEFLNKNIPQSLQKDLNFICSNFWEIEWREATLVNSSYSLPFCLPECFPDVIQSITSNISKGGVFSGNFFGDKDEWNELSLLRKDELLKMFQHFDIVFFNEEETDRESATGPVKHWHIFEITAVKI